MELTVWIVAACLIAYGTKLSGYLLPSSLLEQEAVREASRNMTVGLLAALVAFNAIGSGQALVPDARLVALAAAFVALLLRAPFLAVVIIGALAAAAARWAGMA